MEAGGPGDIDAINGHLTAAMADPIEVGNWSRARARGLSSSTPQVPHRPRPRCAPGWNWCLGAAAQPRLRPRSANAATCTPSLRPMPAHRARDHRNAQDHRQGQLWLRRRQRLHGAPALGRLEVGHGRPALLGRPTARRDSCARCSLECCRGGAMPALATPGPQGQRGLHGKTRPTAWICTCPAAHGAGAFIWHGLRANPPTWPGGSGQALPSPTGPSWWCPSSGQFTQSSGHRR